MATREPCPETTKPISGHVPCRKCGYDLRGLGPGDRCPECGTAAALSLRADLLRYADPAWVAGLARAVRFILWGTLGSIVTVAGGLFLFGDTLLGNLVGSAGALVHLYGAWLLTEPDPATLGRDRTLTVRRVARVALSAGFAAELLHTMLAEAHLPPFLSISLVPLLVGAGFAEAVGEFAKFYHLGTLAQRIPDPKLSRRARLLSWWFAGCVTLAALVGGAAAFVAAAVGPAALPDGLVAAGVAAAAVATLALVAVLVWGLSVQYRMGKAFREQAALAREAWSAAATPASTPAPNERSN